MTGLLPTHARVNRQAIGARKFTKLQIAEAWNDVKTPELEKIYPEYCIMALIPDS